MASSKRLTLSCLPAHPLNSGKTSKTQNRKHTITRSSSPGSPMSRDRQRRYLSSTSTTRLNSDVSQHGPDVPVDQTWLSLANNIREIQNQNAANLSFEENHRFAYNLVLYRQGDLLYKGVNDLVAENLDKLANEQIIPVFPTGAGSDQMDRSHEAEMLLKALARIWEQHRSNMVKLGQILKYMVCLGLSPRNMYNSKPSQGPSAHQSRQCP